MGIYKWKERNGYWGFHTRHSSHVGRTVSAVTAGGGSSSACPAPALLKVKAPLMTLGPLPQTLSIPDDNSCHGPSQGPWAWGFPFPNIQWAASPKTEDTPFYFLVSSPRLGKKQKKTCTTRCHEDSASSAAAKPTGWEKKADKASFV